MNTVKYIAILLLTFGFLSACSDKNTNVDITDVPKPRVEAPQLHQLTTYKSPSCGCCQGWIDHMKTSGYEVTAEHPENLNQLKEQLHVPASLGSCHTSLSSQGYVFEGHIPAKFISQFLENPPEGAYGLAVRGMPMGTPGMEYQNHFTPYKVMQLNKSGEPTLFADVTSLQDQ